ncbi:hypothetical protein BU25DRAFT_350935 [Macroventuria anomochaeta]|uniref:Uncharacterized protein n=1 Tax=Macroventuria anomochaeta TaxID=301207 RepID=A0ACB6RM73_9PLEO|nr:uncharacterized protein BU25DRAFT_350935 [Macroventuria anomochaeta]KAF2622966.1 hypothetical protein BU25DRAFT_350935 [Macroventuria anomochaeta]
MGKGDATRVAQSDSQELQDELDRQLRQEGDDRKRLLAHQKKAQTPAANPKKGLVAASNGPGQTTGTSKPEPSPKPSGPTTSDLGTPLAMHPWEVLTSKEQWSTKPNLRTRQFLEEHGHDATALLEDLQEPAYACRDAEIRDGVWKLTDQIEDFAYAHFGFKVDNEQRLRSALESMQEETVEIIGCVVSGGPAGASGWEDLFLVNDKRQALVCAIIGNVLVDKVFQHIFFGGTAAQIQEIAGLQCQHPYKDSALHNPHTPTCSLTLTGFDRNALYATKSRSFLTSTSKKGKASIGRPVSTLHLPANFNTHVNNTVAALYTHLKPLLHLSRTTTATPLSTNSHSIIPRLHSLTTLAALLSLQMRLDPHTAYHFTPVFKDQPFTHSETECFNHSAMIATHPKGSGDLNLISKFEQARCVTLSDTELARMKRDEGLIQITLLPGITAYRLGGWETPSSAASNPQFEGVGKGKGVRARRLTDAWVYCRWGRQRVWEGGKSADDPAVHGVGWKEGGFVEFFPGVQGVRRDPGPESAARRETAKSKMQEEAGKALTV